MQTQEVAIKRNLKIVLKADAAMLDEVVVVAYGAAKKSSLTGSVEIVKADQLSKVPVNSVDQALQGKAAGVQVTAATGRPGASANIKIRGTSSISAGSDPLFVIDGVPVSSADFAALNSNDIEYMSVLKDASATAIYGSRGSNGVILITTKKGQSGKTTIDLKAIFGISTRTLSDSDFTMMNAQEKLTYERQLGIGRGSSGGANGGAMTDAEIAAAKNTNWADEIFRTGTTQSYELNVAGGTDATRFYLSGQYFDQDAIVPGSYLRRSTLRANLEHKIKDVVKIGFNSSAGISKEGLLRTDRNALNPFNYIFNANPYDAPYNEDGSYNTDMKVAGNQINIFENIANNPASLSKLKIIAAFNLEWRIWDQLKYTTVAGVDFTQYQNYQFNKPESQLSQILGSPYGYRNDRIQQRSTWVWTNMLSYDKTFNDVHEVKAAAAMEAQSSHYRTLTASVSGFATGKLDAISVGATDKDVAGNTTDWRMLSYLATAGYTYDSKYIIDAAIRGDGSSRFASNCRWANFPSVSLGWVISEEKFFKNINMDWFSYLKLRGSWGKLGNERIGAYDDDGNFIYNYYPYQAAIDYSTALFQNSQGIVSSVTTAAQQKYAVRDISWETTESWDIGLDANFLDNRLHFSADYYRKNTKDMLLALEIPHFIGYDNPEVNAGNMHTTGYDIEVGWRDKVGDFTYSISANLSDFTSKMGNLNGTQFLGNQVKMEGSEYNEWYGYVSDGLFLTQEDVDKSPKLNNSVKVGDIKYKDISGPDGVPDGVISPEYDRVLLGGSLPHYMFGLTFNAAYKGWDFGLTLQGVGSQKSQISAAMIEGLRDNWLNFPTILDGNYWSPKNTDEQNATAKYPRLTRTNRDANFCMSDYWLYNGRYIRLKNLSVGYTLPKAWTTKACMNTVRLYVSGSDLFTISNAPKGWDPEVSTEGYPITTSLIFGVSINF